MHLSVGFDLIWSPFLALYRLNSHLKCVVLFTLLLQMGISIWNV